MLPPPDIRRAALALTGKVLEPGSLMKFQTYQAQSADIYKDIPSPGSGFAVRQTNHGPVWEITGDQPPLTVQADGSVIPGTIGGLFPTIHGDAIEVSPAPRLAGLQTSGTRYVMVTVTGTFNLDGGVFVESFASIDSVEISVETSNTALLVSDDGTFRFVLAVFSNGTKTSQAYTGSLNITVCDDLTGSASSQLYIESAA